MTISTYLTRASELQIDRGALASGFPEREHMPGNEPYLPGMTHAPMRLKSKPGEDLSHLNGGPKRLPAFRALLEARGETITGLAMKSGLARETIRQLVSSPHRYSDGSRAKLKALLAPAEWKMVEGKV